MFFRYKYKKFFRDDFATAKFKLMQFFFYIYKGTGTQIHFFEIFLKFYQKHYLSNISTCSMKFFK